MNAWDSWAERVAKYYTGADRQEFIDRLKAQDPNREYDRVEDGFAYPITPTNNTGGWNLPETGQVFDSQPVGYVFDIEGLRADQPKDCLCWVEMDERKTHLCDRCVNLLLGEN